MRKISFIKDNNDIKKLMINVLSEGVYLFGYDCLQDSACIWDNFYFTVEKAEQYSKEFYNVDKNDWIIISDALEGFQQDFIMPTKVKGKDNGIPEWGKFQTLIGNKWFDVDISEKCLSLSGLTGNERLFITGLINEFDQAMITDKPKAEKILKVLELDKD